MNNPSLHMVRDPRSGEPFYFTFDKQDAWDKVFESTVTMCHPDDVFDHTLTDVESFSTWDEMKMAMGEHLTPEEIEILYTKRYVYL